MFSLHSSQETAPEKVLRLALELPATQPELEREAFRIEQLLDNLTSPITPVGEELQCALADAMELLLDGIYVLIQAEIQEDFDQGCAAVLQCHATVQDLQERLAEMEEEVVLVA